MATRNSQIQDQASRLINQLSAVVGGLDQFCQDPATTIVERLDLKVEFRSQPKSPCGVSGSFHPENRVIVVENALSPGRVRFTLLHELAHALGYRDSEFQDWKFGLEQAGQNAEERVANAFAAELLLPTVMVDQCIPKEGPTAWDVAQLWKQSRASREAVCVRAAQRLCSPGLVVLVSGSTIQFAAGSRLVFRVPRDCDQGAGSFFDRATRMPTLRETDVEIRLPDNQFSGAFMADAFLDDGGYAFAVLQEEDAPWVPTNSFSSGPDYYEVECPTCDTTRFTKVRICPKCGDRPCPDHGCSCKLEPWRDPKARHCERCHVELPRAAPPNARFCDRHD